MGTELINEVEKILEMKFSYVVRIKKILEELFIDSENKTKYMQLMTEIKCSFIKIDLLDDQASNILKSLNYQNSQKLNSILQDGSFSEIVAENISAISEKLHNDLDTIMNLDKVLTKELIELNHQYSKALTLASSYQEELTQ